LSAPGLVTLLTDFGVADGYVGAVKGVLLTRLEAAGVRSGRVVDLTHAVPPGDVAYGSYVWAQAAPWFPPGTVHLGVVDPGVGSERRAIALQMGAHRYVAPDNGLVSHVAAETPPDRVHLIEAPAFAPPDASPTFHGRDVFARAAAHLAAGGPWEALGSAIDPAEIVLQTEACAEREDEGWRARVIHVDHFGNLVTNLRLPAESSGGHVQLGTDTIEFHSTYSDVAPGALLALRGSTGRLEVAVRDGSAAERLGKSRGDVIWWRVLESR